MLPPFLIGIFFMLIAAIASATFTSTDSATATKRDIQATAQRAVAESVVTFYNENSAFPSSLKALAGTAAYWHLREHLPRPPDGANTSSDTFGGSERAVAAPRFALSSPYVAGLDSDFWRFQRASVFTPINPATVDSDYWAASGNQCGTGAFASTTDLSWCGNALTGVESVLTDRALVGNLETAASAQQQLTLDKLVQRYDVSYAADATNAFPPLATATALNSLAIVTVSGAATGLIPLPASARPGTSRATCSGTYYWKVLLPAARKWIPLTCGDIYNYWGNPVYYQKLSNRQVTLTSNSKYLQADGLTPKVVTTSVTLTY